MTEERTIYQACPSQVGNLGPFVLAAFTVGLITTVAVLTNQDLLFILLIFPVSYAFWKWLQTKNNRLTLTTQRLIINEGILNRHTVETELYRVRDTAVTEPFWQRMFGLGNIQVFTTDENAPTHVFAGFHKPHWVKDQIRNNAEICRRSMRWGNDNVILHDHLNP